MRIEKDYLGEVHLDDDVYYGISTFRALDNFNVSDLNGSITNNQLQKNSIKKHCCSLWNSNAFFMR